MRAIHVSMRVAPVCGALGHGDPLKFIIIIIIIIIIIVIIIIIIIIIITSPPWKKWMGVRKWLRSLVPLKAVSAASPPVLPPAVTVAPSGVQLGPLSARPRGFHELRGVVHTI